MRFKDLLKVGFAAMAIASYWATSANPVWAADSSDSDKPYSFRIVEKSSAKEQFVQVRAPLTPVSELQNYSPEKISSLFKQHQSQSSALSKAGSKKDLFKHTAFDFPKESAVFFAGVGGVLLLQMLSDYESNPMALAQQIESLSNPVGHFSFFMFMYANRLSMSLWPELLKNKALWPYLGMTVGMLASDLTSQVLEPLRPCATDLFRAMKDKSTAVPTTCSQAYQHLVLKDNLLEIAPSLSSMLMSTWLAGTLQKSLLQGFQSKSFQKIAQSPLVWKTVNIGSYLFPGTAALKIGATAMNLFQISLFVGIDHQLSPIVRANWNNITQGYMLRESTSSLTKELLALKKNQWSMVDRPSDFKKCISKDDKETCYHGFVARLLDFQEKMAHWRQANLEPVRMAHSSWNQKLSQLSAGFDGSYQVYNHVINAIIASRQGKESPIDEADPFNGIKPLLPDPEEEFPEGGYLDGYWQAQNFQKARLKKAAQIIYQRVDDWQQETLWEKAANYLKIDTDGNSKKIPPSLQLLKRIAGLWEAKQEQQMLMLIRKFRDSSDDLKEKEREQLKEALVLLSSQEVELLLATSTDERSEAQDESLLACLRYWFDRETEKMAEGTLLFAQQVQKTLGVAKSHQYLVQKIYDEIVHEIGTPKPFAEKGRAYLQHFSIHPEFKKYFELINYPRTPGRYQLHSPAEYIVHQMICGPEAEERAPLIKKSWASYDQFVPPRVRALNHQVLEFCESQLLPGNRSMYSEPLKVLDGHGQIRNYSGLFDYLKQNLRPEVIEPIGQRNTFIHWWDQHVAPQLDQFLNEHARSYGEVIAKFRYLARNREVDHANLGPIFNSPIWSAQQEIRFYSLVVGEYIKDLAKLKPELKRALIPSEQNLWLDRELKNYQEGQWPLFSILKFNGNPDLAGISRTLPSLKPSMSPAVASWDVEILRRFDYEFTNLAQLLTQSGQQRENQKRRNERFAQAMKNVETQFMKLKELISSDEFQELSEQSKNLIGVCFDGIDKVIKEINSYRLIVSLLDRDADGKADDNNCRATQNRVGQVTVVCP